MRLIDADEAKKFYKENLILPEKSHEIIVRTMIDAVPTAYDVDEVVEELKERKILHERLVEYENKNGTVTEKYQHIKAIDVLNDAIEIVKQGGVRKESD